MAGLASLALVAGVVLVGSSSGVQASPGAGLVTGPADKIRPELQAVFDSAGRADFWVRFGDRADLSGASRVGGWDARGAAVAAELRATAAASQGPVVDLLEEPGSGQVSFRAFWATNAVYVFDAPVGLAQQLAGFAQVEGLYAPVGYELVEPSPGVVRNRINAVEWGIANINADDVWDSFGVRGEGITVASIDTGAQFDHPALVGQYRGNLGGGGFDHNYNWFDAAGNCAAAPCDLNGHGTHTMGTMAGDDGGDNQIGVAPGVSWIAANGCCPSDAALIASGQWMLEPTDLAGQNPDASKRPHIVNNSWGTTAPSNDPFMEDILQAWAASGIFGVWSNGNNGPGCATSGSPGSRILNYSAGAYDINNTIAGFSSRGPGQSGQIKPNISAPGVNVRSSVPTDSYAAFNGTSMAAPHVAGSIALAWSAAPSLIGDIAATRALLDETAADSEDLQCGGDADDNNVYGEGRLDALALLNAAPVGDAGTLAGTVSDAGTGDPIQDAAVHITGGEVDRTLATAADGSYQTTLLGGDYTVAVSAFGYATQTTQLTISPGQTTTADFAMVASPTVNVSGLIRDGSGHGWPIYAKLSIQGAPAAADYSNPFTGRYRLQLPANATYTLNIESQYPGYQNLTETIQVGSSNLVRDFDMLVDVNQCQAAPGYELEQPEMAMVTSDPGGQFADYFAGRGITVDFFSGADIDQITGYDVVLWGYHTSGSIDGDEFLGFLDSTDAEGTGVVFLDHAFTTGNGIKTLSEYTGNPESVSTSTAGTGQQNLYQVTQEHPVLAGFEVGDQIIHEPNESAAWVAWFDGYQGEGRQVIADLGRTGDGILGSGIGVQERANNRHVLLSIHSSSATRGPTGWSTESHDVFWNAVNWASPEASSFECTPVDGGLVAGFVRDRNTGAGINGALVVSEDVPAESASTSATPDDEGIDDGFYWLFSSVSGAHRFTASAGSYQDLTRQVLVEADWTTRRNFQLAAGRLEVAPQEVSAQVPLGGSAQRTLTISNSGTAPAQVELSEREGGFEILRADGSSISGAQLAAAAGAPLRRVELAGVDAADLAGSFAPPLRAGAAAGPGPAPGAEPWLNIASMPRTIMDHNMVTVDGQLYSFGGSSGTTSLAEVYRYDPGAQAWSQLANMPDGPRHQSAQGVIGGKVYLVSGWSNLDSATLIYDPATDSWDSGAAAPAGRAAAGAAVLNEALYLVGGCTTNACAPYANGVFRYEPGSDSWDTLAPYPAPTAWQSCAGIAGQLICAGGLDNGNPTTAAYAYDPGADAWSAIPDMPANLWGAGYGAANGQLLISGGLSGASTITNEGYAYDPAAGTWSTLPASNHLLFRPGSGCGFYKAGGSVIAGFQPTNAGELLPGFDQCGSTTDVPWLALDPTQATLAPGASITITVNLNAQVTQPGTYTAQIAIAEDTPYSVAPLDVAMHVTPPPSWGKITGTVQATSCNGQTAPLPDATVHLSTWVMELTLFSNPEGNYAHWLDFRHSPFFMIVAKDGYQPQFRQTSVTAGQTTTENWNLQAVCATSANHHPL